MGPFLFTRKSAYFRVNSLFMFEFSHEHYQLTHLKPVCVYLPKIKITQSSLLKSRPSSKTKATFFSVRIFFLSSSNQSTMEEKSKEAVKKCYVHEDTVLNKPQLGFTKFICDNTRTEFKQLNDLKFNSFKEEIQLLMECAPAPLYGLQKPLDIVVDARNWIDTKSSLYNLVEKLKEEMFIAVDT